MFDDKFKQKMIYKGPFLGYKIVFHCSENAPFFQVEPFHCSENAPFFRVEPFHCGENTSFFQVEPFHCGEKDFS